MSPPARDLRTLAGYLTFSGAATMTGGWLVFRAADRVVELPLRTKAFVGSIIGTTVALLNVAIVAQLMFVSTAHDLKLLIALLVFCAVVTLFFSLLVAATVAVRVNAVAASIRGLAVGPQPSSEMRGGDEVAQLSADVSALAARLHSVQEQRQVLDRERHELTAAISHDLRTPLASIRAMVEALADNVVADPNEARRYFALMQREIERLDHMIDDLFALAQIDAGALRLNRAPLALQEVVEEVVDGMQARAHQRDVALSVRVHGQPPNVPLDGARIERAVSNLARNAVEHTPEGGRVAIDVSAADGYVQMRIWNSGPEIDESDLQRIWERFYRAERSRRRSNGQDGGGLGLAIVKGFIEAHAGTVEATSAVGQGVTFVVRLPVSSG